MREIFTSGSVGGLVEQSPILPGDLHSWSEIGGRQIEDMHGLSKAYGNSYESLRMQKYPIMLHVNARAR